MKKIFSGLLFSVLFVTSFSVYAEDYNDLFWGMLKKDNGSIVFTRCDRPSLKMKIVETDDVNKSNVEVAYHMANAGKRAYFAFIGHVKEDVSNSYTFYIKDVVETKLGSSCNLAEMLDD